MFNADGRLFGDKIQLICWDSNNITGIPDTWPECKQINDTCEILTPPEESKIGAQPEDTEEPKLNQFMTYKCTEDSDVLDTDGQSIEVNIYCKIQSTDTEPYYQVTLDIENWPTCQAPEGGSEDGSEAQPEAPSNSDQNRKKRQIEPKIYQYINVVVDLQLMEYSPVIDEAIRFVSFYNFS